MNTEKLKLAFRIVMFVWCFFMSYSTIMGFVGIFGMMSKLNGLNALGLLFSMTIATLTPWLYIMAIWCPAEILFDMSDKFAKMADGGRDKPVSHGSSQTNWENWKKVGK